MVHRTDPQLATAGDGDGGRLYRRQDHARPFNGDNARDDICDVSEFDAYLTPLADN